MFQFDPKTQVVFSAIGSQMEAVQKCLAESDTFASVGAAIGTQVQAIQKELADSGKLASIGGALKYLDSFGVSPELSAKISESAKYLNWFSVSPELSAKLAEMARQIQASNANLAESIQHMLPKFKGLHFSPPTLVDIDKLLEPPSMIDLPFDEDDDEPPSPPVRGFGERRPK